MPRGRVSKACTLPGIIEPGFDFQSAPEPLEIVEQIVDSLISRSDILSQRAVHNLLNLWWSFRQQLGKRRGLALEYRHDDVAYRGALERHLSREHLVDKRAEAEDVGPGVNREPARLLG